MIFGWLFVMGCSGSFASLQESYAVMFARRIRRKITKYIILYEFRTCCVGKQYILPLCILEISFHIILHLAYTWNANVVIYLHMQQCCKNTQQLNTYYFAIFQYQYTNRSSDICTRYFANTANTILFMKRF